jgi:beta-phosphoglucomutase-like phosphatase (HAD superfamily)
MLPNTARRALALLCALPSLVGLAGAFSVGRPPMPVRGALFDFDNTLVQSEELHRQCYGLVLGEEIDERTWVTDCVGTSPRELLARRLPAGRLRPGETIDDLIEQRCALFEEKVEQGLLEETRGAARLLGELGAASIPCAVVSSGSRRYIVKGLDALDFSGSIETIVAGDDEEICPDEDDDDSCLLKPEPFPYLLAAQRLGLRPEECVAFEDSLSGIRSAQAAGMRVIVIRSEATAALPTAADPLAAPPPAPEEDGPILPVTALVEDFDAIPRAYLGLS